MKRMVEFVTQSQGLDTFLECEIKDGMQIDTVGLGMILNNRIDGLCSISDIHIDNNEFIRYNISSQISLQQFFMEKMDKKRFLTILENILQTMESIEDYLLEPGMVLLDTEYIYINVSSLRTSLIYYPLVNEKKDFNIKNFVKSLIISMEFDTQENDNYISLLLNYLNRSNVITVSELKDFIISLRNTQPSPVINDTYYPDNHIQNNQNQNDYMNLNNFGQNSQNQNVYSNVNNFGQNSPSNNGFSDANSFSQNSPGNNGFSDVNNFVQSSQSQNNFSDVNNLGQFNQNPNMQVPNQPLPQVPEQNNKEKKGFLSGLFHKDSKNEADKKETKKEKKKKEKKPEQASLSQSLLMSDSKPISQQTPGSAPMSNVEPFQMPASQPVQIPAPQPAPIPAPMPVPTPAPVPASQSMPQQNVNSQPDFGYQPNYGGTVVLGMMGDDVGATTILSDGYNTVQRQQLPYLIRKKTNEKIEINKEIFKIGKERSYVDYCVADNSAVSRSHANIIKKNNEFYIIDNNSLNHTFLDGKQIPSQQMFKLEDFMLIKMADEMFEFRL